MTEPKKFFVCGICGNQVELFEDGGGDLVCCGEPMMIMEESCRSACDEAHEIQMEKIPGGIRLTVGKNMHHPMTPGHLIQWIECWIGNHTFRKHFDPGDEPVAEFMIGECCENGERPGVRLHCNVHGMRYCGSEKSTTQTSCETKTCTGQEKRIPV
ncbi:MAG: desulfoferrodoxin FeS4 iron-binding domain-containing protein [Thermoguttaceae bacterium]|nr:desulfoferrodoxin FeS4 iron-binding domain-containing protein [Thermoguttaceae bacterium]MBR0192184.1 desulfoferrodoxin FeS4 iron-binding domain-containing protein [Thermoguttaceae bacterium]